MIYAPLYFAVFAFGAMVGSFLNVCIHRLPKGESIVFPGSHCGSCLKPVRWHDNVPILSYALLRGRCRDCKAKFSAEYLFVEAAAGAIFVLFYHYFGLTPEGGAYLLMTMALLAQAMIDFHHRIIPDVITLPGIVLGVVLSALFPGIHDAPGWLQGLIASGSGVLVGGGFLLMLGVVAEFLLKKEAMGGGDVKLLAMIGAFIGVTGVAWTLFGGALLGSVAGIYYKLVAKEEQIPFGPFLGAAAVAYLFFGQQVIGAYLNYMQQGFSY